MGRFRLAFLVVLASLVAACGSGAPPDTLYVYRQRVPGTSLVIYDVTAYYQSIGGRWERGLLVADSTEQFKYNMSDLTGYAVITQSGVNGIEFVSYTENDAFLRGLKVTDELLEPVRTTRRMVGGIEVRHIRYRVSTGGEKCLFREFEFDSVEVQTDSLIAYGRLWDDEATARVSLPKTDVKIDLDRLGFIQTLRVEEFFVGIGPVKQYPPLGPNYFLDRAMVCSARTHLVPGPGVRQSISEPSVFSLYYQCDGDC